MIICFTPKGTDSNLVHQWNELATIMYSPYTMCLVGAIDIKKLLLRHCQKLQTSGCVSCNWFTACRPMFVV